MFLILLAHIDSVNVLSLYAYGKQYLEPVLSQANKVKVNPGVGHCGLLGLPVQ